MTQPLRRLGWLTARLFLGGVYAYAGFMKLMEPAANFQAALEQYPLLPVWALPLLARTVPWAEWLLGMFLLVGYGIRVSSLLLGLLSLSFIGILSNPQVWRQAIDHCGCFGVSGIRLSVMQAYLLDWLCLGLAWALCLKRRHLFALENGFPL